MSEIYKKGSLGFVISDGGRMASGFEDEHSDCTVRALAKFMNLPYAWAHAELKKVDRKEGRGVRLNALRRIYDQYGEYKEFGYMQPTLARFVRSRPQGRYIVLIKGHALTVVDGVIHDTGTSGSRCRVKGFWKELESGE